MNKNVVMLIVLNCVSWCYAMEQQRELKIGIYSDVNQREYQEDRFYHGDVDGGKFYAVYDGHGISNGHEVADFLAHNMHVHFGNTTGAIPERFIKTFHAVDCDEFVISHKQAGSTASVVFIKDKIAHFAHVGDSRALVEHDGKLIFATQDHKPNREDETKRIKDAQGFVLHNRVNGIIAVSRVVGDYGIDREKKIIIAQPECTQLPLSEQHKFLVLATDGLWDTMSNDDVVKCLNNNCVYLNDMNLLAKLLALSAIKKGSADNITVMIVDLLS